jgi:hypothetical protein
MTVNTYRSESTQAWETEGGAEKLERGVAPCRLLKLRQMETKGVHMKGVLPRLVPWARRDFCPDLAVLVGPVQNIFFHRTLFHFICFHRLAS